MWVATVGMDDHKVRLFAFENGYLKGIAHQISGHPFGHEPTNDLTGKQVNDHR